MKKKEGLDYLEFNLAASHTKMAEQFPSFSEMNFAPLVVGFHYNKVKINETYLKSSERKTTKFTQFTKRCRSRS